MSDKKIFEIVKSFNVMEWVVFIKTSLDIPQNELKRYGFNELDLFNLKNTNWHSVILDLVLRIAPYNKSDKIKINNKIMIRNYLNIIATYINYRDKDVSHKKNIEYSIFKTMSLLMNDQLRNISPELNSLGRLISLYSEQEALFKQEFGLTPEQILNFYLFVSSFQSNNIVLPKKKLTEVLSEIDSTITNKKLNQFLELFSVSIKNYRLYAKKLGIEKNRIRSKQIILEYPIIDYNDFYIVPSNFVLLESLSYKIFDKINITDKRIRTFGDTFENYIRYMSRYFHKKYFYECSNLIEDKDEGSKKAEFYLKNDELSLVIEAKVLHIDDNLVSEANIGKIDKKFKKTLMDAIKQIDSCNKELKNMYSIIVIHTHLPIINVFMDSIKKRYKDKYSCLDKMVLLTVIDYENLISLPLNEIVKRIEELQSSLFKIIEGRENLYLLNEYNKFISQNCEN